MFGESSECGQCLRARVKQFTPGESGSPQSWEPGAVALIQGLLLTSGRPVHLGHPGSVPHILTTPFRLSGPVM